MCLAACLDASRYLAFCCLPFIQGKLLFSHQQTWQFDPSRFLFSGAFRSNNTGPHVFKGISRYVEVVVSPPCLLRLPPWVGFKGKPKGIPFRPFGGSNSKNRRTGALAPASGPSLPRAEAGLRLPPGTKWAWSPVPEAVCKPGGFSEDAGWYQLGVFFWVLNHVFRCWDSWSGVHF